MAPLWSHYHGKKASESRKKVHSKKELGPWQCAGRRCTSFNEVTEILGESSFIWSRCCRGCSPAGLLRRQQSTRPGLCRRAGRWPARGNWPPWGRRRDLPLSGSSCGGREKTRGCWWCYSHREYVSNQCTSVLPDTVHHSVIGLLVSSFFERLQPCLYHWRRQTWLIIIINSSSRRRSILACNSSSDLRFSILTLLSAVSVINVYKIPSTSKFDTRLRPDSKFYMSSITKSISLGPTHQTSTTLTITGADSHGSDASSRAAGHKGPVERHGWVVSWALAELVQVRKQREVDDREGDVPAKQKDSFTLLMWGEKWVTLERSVEQASHLSRVAPSPL